MTGTDDDQDQIHATCIAMDGGGVLIRGASGSGKSDLALRLMDAGARLVADDRVDLTGREGRLTATPPANIAGLLEVRGLGILRFNHLPEVRVDLVVELADGAHVARLPEPASCTICGIEVPLMRLAAFEASTAAKVRLALGLAAGRIMRGDD